MRFAFNVKWTERDYRLRRALPYDHATDAFLGALIRLESPSYAVKHYGGEDESPSFRKATCVPNGCADGRTNGTYLFRSPLLFCVIPLARIPLPPLPIFLVLYCAASSHRIPGAEAPDVTSICLSRRELHLRGDQAAN